MSDLGEFDGRPVTRTAIAVTNAGDGLSAAVGVDPVILHIGDEGYLIIKYKVAKVRFETKDDELSRVHVLRTTAATLSDLPAVRKAVEAQDRRIQAARELAGQLRMDENDPVEAHNRGEHAATLVDGCPECQAEREFMEDGQ